MENLDTHSPETWNWAKPSCTSDSGSPHPPPPPAYWYLGISWWKVFTSHSRASRKIYSTFLMGYMTERFWHIRAICLRQVIRPDEPASCGFPPNTAWNWILILLLFLDASIQRWDKPWDAFLLLFKRVTAITTREDEGKARLDYIRPFFTPSALIR